LSGRTLRARWLRFWFEPAPPTDLAVCRILFFTGVFASYLHFDAPGLADLPEAMWTPTWLFALLRLPLFAAPRLRLLEAVWRLALLTSAVGFATRASTAASFVLGFYLIGLPHNFGKVNHNDAIIVLLLAVMALSRSGDALSVDAAVARLRHRRSIASASAPSGEYTWPLRCAWLAIALVYFAAGVAKLRYGGTAWITSSHVATLFLRSQYELHPATAWGPWLARSSWLCHVLAAATVAVELFYPLALVSRRARALLVPGAIGIQIAIGLLVGPRFYDLLMCNLFWVPWTSCGKRIAQKEIRRMSRVASRRTRQLVCIVSISLAVFAAAACGDRTSTAAGSGAGGQISADEASALVDRYISAFNTRDRNTYISLFADGATVEDPLGSPPIGSASQLGAFFDATTSVPLHLELEKDSIRVSGTHVAFRFQLELGAGTSQVATKPVDVLDLDGDGKIVSLVAYWKPADLRPVQ